jgi:HlyD family secretion protein
MTGKLKYLVLLALPAAGLVSASVWLPALLAGSDGVVYETVEVARGPIRKVVSTSGPVRALVTVSVGSQLSGQVRELKADFNTEVKAGDELAVIDDKTFVARVAQARADLAAAKAMLANQEAALVKAQAIERNAGLLMERAATLAKRGIAATATLDNATRDAEVARAEIEVARAQVENAKATIAQRESQLQQAQIDLERTRIRSPIDGTVIMRTVDVGQTVAASLQAPELFKIAQDLRRIRIEAQVSEADVGAVSEGNGVEFTVDAYPERRFQGRVTQVRLGATELNNVVTYTVIIEASNDDRKLLPGMTATARIESAKVDDALRVPNEALRFTPRGALLLASTRQRSIRRLDQVIAQAKTELALSGEQAAKVADAVKGGLEQRQTATSAVASGSARTAPGGDTEARMMQRLVHALAGIVTDAQRPAFEAWRAQQEIGRGRSGRRDMTVWVLDASGTLESRQVRVGLADDHFSEALGDALKEGDKVVLRSRDAARK